MSSIFHNFPQRFHEELIFFINILKFFIKVYIGSLNNQINWMLVSFKVGLSMSDKLLSNLSSFNFSAL